MHTIATIACGAVLDAVHHFVCRCLPGRPLQRAPREACRATPPGRSEAPLYAAPPRALWLLLDRFSLHAGGLSIRMRRWSCPFVYRQVVRRMRTRTAEPNARPCLSFDRATIASARLCVHAVIGALRRTSALSAAKSDSVSAGFATECALVRELQVHCEQRPVLHAPFLSILWPVQCMLQNQGCTRLVAAGPGRDVCSGRVQAGMRAALDFRRCAIAHLVSLWPFAPATSGRCPCTSNT